MTAKHWLLVIIFAVLIAWIVIDHFSSWITTIHGDSKNYWFDCTCKRCKYTEIKFNLDDLNKRCPRCERRMTNAR